VPPGALRLVKRAILAIRQRIPFDEIVVVLHASKCYEALVDLSASPTWKFQVKASRNATLYV
jgi:hypothetical protein